MTNDDIHLIRLQHGKANAIDGAFLSILSSTLDEGLESGKRAIVLTGHEGFFSAGLNLKDLPGERREMAAFVDRFEQLHRKLLELPVPLVVAVNGHAIAGGCILACTGDLRIGAEGSYRIGVSEVSLGIVFPATAFEIMRHTLDPRFATDVLLGGTLLDPNGAQQAGILHRVVPRDDLLDAAYAAARELGTKPPIAFRHSKLALRKPMLERIETAREESRELFLDTWFSPEVVERRKAMLAR